MLKYFMQVQKVQEIGSCVLRGIGIAAFAYVISKEVK